MGKDEISAHVGSREHSQSEGAMTFTEGEPAGTAQAKLGIDRRAGAALVRSAEGTGCYKTTWGCKGKY
jgi:hypothetical protein